MCISNHGDDEVEVVDSANERMPRRRPEKNNYRVNLKARKEVTTNPPQVDRQVDNDQLNKSMRNINRVTTVINSLRQPSHLPPGGDCRAHYPQNYRITATIPMVRNRNGPANHNTRPLLNNKPRYNSICTS